MTLPFEIIRDISIEEIKAELDGPVRVPNPNYQEKRWYEFWKFEEPEYFEKGESYLSELSNMINAYEENGGTIHEYSTFRDAKILEGEAGYVLLRGEEVIIEIIRIQS